MRDKQAAGDFIAGNEVFWGTDMAFGVPTILAGGITAIRPDSRRLESGHGLVQEK